MKIIPPSTPPPPLTPEEQALVAESRAFLESLKDRPLVSEGLQERGSDETEDSGEPSDSDGAPLI